MADGRIVGQHDVEHGDENQEEREDAQEGRKGQVCDKIPRVVVAELLHDPEYQGGGAESLLRGIDPSHGLLNRLHPYPSRRFVLSYPKLPASNLRLRDGAPCVRLSCRHRRGTRPPTRRRPPTPGSARPAGPPGLSARRPWARPGPSWAWSRGSCSHTWRARTIRSNPAWATTTTPSPGLASRQVKTPSGRGGSTFVIKVAA